MQASNFDLTQYLRRIGFEGEARADLATVAQMMRHQLFSVPFENLDVQAGKVVSLVPEEIVDKIVNRRRGGYCYEVNGLFAMALTALGITYRFLAARPMFYPVRRPRTHVALLVTLGNEDYLVDLGFGSYGIRQPLALSSCGDSVAQDHDRFMLSKSNERDYLLQAWVDGAWANQYGFDLSYQEWIDFVPANYLNSTHPDAIFVQKLLVVLHHATGRNILFGDSLKLMRDGQVEQISVPPGQIASTLQEVFQLRQD